MPSDPTISFSQDAMALLLPDDDEMGALEAALNFVDAFAGSADASNASAVGAARSPEPEIAGIPHLIYGEGAGQLDADLDRLLLQTLSSSSPSSSSEIEGDAIPTLTQSAHSRQVLPSPLPPLASNVSAPDVVELKENGRLRGRCRAAHCEATTETGGKVKRRAKVNPNRARNERKHELAYLRSKVQQMETELGALHRRHRIESAGNAALISSGSSLGALAFAGSTSASNSTATAGIPPFWRDMAARQKLRREKAERENARLRLVLEGQIKLAKSMEALLLKRARQQVTECEGFVGVKSTAQGRTLDFLTDEATFDALLASTDKAFHELDDVFAANGLNNRETPCREAHMREGANGMYLDISSNKLLPFDMQAVANAVWNHFKGCDKHRGNLYQKVAKNIEATADTVMEDFVMEFMGKSTRADFRVKQVLRRYVETEREVVVWVTSVHSLDEDKDRPFFGLGFAEKGYVVIKRPTSPTLTTGGFTLLQMCSLVVPQKAERCVQDATSVGAFTEFVLNVIATNTTVSQELIENVLLDQELKHRPPAA
ncbi:hypothetical protein BBJ28_00010356 [Nothophytophthora sp. Chile5]|nr:hypothetical protein BBJ28_00010356 [Nothophytophthora sp. Chile5]